MRFNAASTDDYLLGTVTSLAGLGLKNETDDTYSLFVSDSGNLGIASTLLCLILDIGNNTA